MEINNEDARRILEERDNEFNNVREVGEDVQLNTSQTIPPPKPKANVPNTEPIKPQTNVDYQEPVVKQLHPNFNVGWYELPLESLPSKGWFYPEGSRLTIKAASVSVIRQFSTVDENNPIELNDAFDYILENLVNFRISDDRPVSYKNLKEIDKISVILHVRDLTFKNGESKIISEITCNGCGNVDEKSLKWSDFEFFKPSDDLIRLYDADSKVFRFELQDGTVQMTMPSIGVRSFIQKYVMDRIQKRKSYDKAFASIAPYIIDDYSNLNNTIYENLVESSADWSISQFGALVRIQDLIKNSTVSRIKHRCTKCSAEVTAKSAFRGGIKSLFIPDLQSIAR